MISPGVVEDVLGRRPLSVQRLGGGTRKGVYRLGMPGGGTAVAYSWAAAENYWPRRDGDGALDDPFSAGSGLELFRAGHDRLRALGLRVPEIYAVGPEPAIVEDFPRC